mgnify:CR=1 FL=1
MVVYGLFSRRFSTFGILKKLKNQVFENFVIFVIFEVFVEMLTFFRFLSFFLGALSCRGLCRGLCDAEVFAEGADLLDGGTLNCG